MNEHNWAWINENREKAKIFAEKFDPFTLAASDYNPVEHSIMKITARESHIEFLLLWAINHKRSSEGISLDYEHPPFEFDDLLKKTYKRCCSKIDIK